jgi:hypothetical protein
MASLLTPRRTEAASSRRKQIGVRLEATIPLVRALGAKAEAVGAPLVGWPIAAVAGGLAAAFFGWVLMAGLAVVGWLAASPGSLAGALDVGTQLWLLANGAGARLGATSLTLIPWGATAVLAVMLSSFAAFAVRQSRAVNGAAVAKVVAVVSATYMVAVAVVTIVAGQSAGVVRGVLVSLLVAGAASAWGACRALRYDPTVGWPSWSRVLPRAVLVAALTMIVGGAAALVTALVANLERVEQLTRALDTGVAGGIALLLAQLAFAPNLIIWSASYTLGAGFSLGAGSLVMPVDTDLGLLPAIPVFGALPPEGPGSRLLLLWLVVAVLAGSAAAVCVVRARPAARFDETSLVGGLAGAGAGVLFAVLGWASGGDLGTVRLAAMGPQLTPLTVMAATAMGLSGMIVALAVGLRRQSRG